MTEVASPFPTAAAEAPAPKVKTARAPAAVIELVTPSGDKLKAIKYPMPLKAPRFMLNVNGQDCVAAQTTFGAILYTYFQFNGASFYVPGHHKEGEFKLTYPENYKFEPLKLDRAAQSAAAAKAKAAKAPATEAAASGDAGSETAAEASDTSGANEAPAATAEEPVKAGRKAKR